MPNAWYNLIPGSKYRLKKGSNLWREGDLTQEID